MSLHSIPQYRVGLSTMKPGLIIPEINPEDIDVQGSKESNSNINVKMLLDGRLIFENSTFSR